MKRTFSSIALYALFCAVSTSMVDASLNSAFAQSDPMLGTWRLNLGKSTFSPGPAPRSSVLTVAAAGQGQIFTFDTTNAQGMVVKTEFTIITDGQPHPATTAAADAVSIKRINPYLQYYSLMKAGAEVQTGGLAVSTDGKTATFMNTGKGANGQPISNIQVFEKQ